MNSLHDLDRSIDLWFEEDIKEGDHTTLSAIPKEASGKAVLHVKQDGIIAGISVAERVFKRFDPQLKVSVFMEDGDAISVGDRILEVEGRVHTILQCERLVLNIMQRMSGIATSTREYVLLIEGTGTRILDTRKTTPGFRLLEKEAVRLGGGVNHRFGLYDMIMIKDNHIDFAGGIEKAISGTLLYLKKNNLDLQIEIETRNLADVEEVLRNGKVHRIMLDNFTIPKTREAVALIDGRMETESSGGITRDTLRAYAECGVDYISVGALTHQLKSLDLSLKADF
ncbi:MAG: carboxylating nicotinate-nucleotide diphosphorylase [Bacteroides sp.]|nr:carboxylating nicotinate-nucleotide diphosphorylase [Bacteroides sp.]